MGFQFNTKALAWLLGVLLLTALGFIGGAGARNYEQGNTIPILANRVGPYHNPTEMYQYYKLPFCQPEHGQKYKILGLGEVLEGDRMVNTPYDIHFKENVANKVLCSKSLGQKEVKDFRDAVKWDYYFQMFLDDLPVWGFIGKVEKRQNQPDRYFLFTHFHFDLAYNNSNVVEVNVSSDPMRAVDVTNLKDMNVEFSYSVQWHPSPVTYAHRMDRYVMYSFMQQNLEIHWFSIINSCVTVLLLTGFLTTILLRVLKNDFMKITPRADLEGAPEEDDDTGWKYLHGDVFRFPQHTGLFSAMMGVGTQMFAIALFIFCLSLIGMFYPYNRGALLSACVVLYALTAGIAGYVSGTWYKMLGGHNWVANVLMTAVLWFGPVTAVFSFLNTVAIFYRSTAALPFGTIVVIIFLWSLITFPLTVLGGIAAKNSKAEFNAPCRTTLPREIPPLPWYRQTIPQMCMAGFLPFSAIYIELYYIFASIWGYKVYTIYSVLFIVFIILIIVTAFVCVALTYFQLAVEDHRWWWRSFLCGGSTGFFIFGYCIYYYYYRSQMSGLMQTSFFFGYNALVCYAFVMMLGSIGFRASLMFVRRIYQAIKSE